ncbi:MAG: NADH-quinone oxidoreductase subunit NuoE [Promethearchaeota archaeon]|nr:MAG: NADH-quinone oxidoreductase subunit NuoE [Candidatus Lokiarchaeota archaeon]
MSLNQNIVFKISDDEKSEIDKILTQFHYKSSNLISILQSIQEKYGYLPRNIIFYMSEELMIPTAEIYGVGTFYTQFKFNEVGKNLIICCDGTACHVNGSTQIIDFIQDYLGIKPGETTENKKFTLETVACLGCCAISPVCIINGKIYGEITTSKVKKVIKRLMKKSNVDETNEN